jgi:hypothetical protein
MNPMTNFMEKTKGLTKNPIGIIALFISLIYGFACLVLSTSLSNLQGQEERLPLIWFIILFPVVILIGFIYLVVCHYEKLYAPSDWKNEENFINVFMGNKEVPSDLEKVNDKLKSLISDDEKGEKLINSISKISKEIEKIKEKSQQIPINSLWRLNHWGSNCASIVGDKMIFKGTSAPKGTDGSHIDLNNLLEIGKTYEISCFAKSLNNTNGMFQLWCHDNTGTKPDGVSEMTEFKTLSTEGERIQLNFKAAYNKNIRLHLQYKPGQGQIEVTDVKINEFKN